MWVWQRDIYGQRESVNVSHNHLLPGEPSQFIREHVTFLLPPPGEQEESRCYFCDSNENLGKHLFAFRWTAAKQNGILIDVTILRKTSEEVNF